MEAHARTGNRTPVAGSTSQHIEPLYYTGSCSHWDSNPDFEVESLNSLPFRLQEPLTGFLILAPVASVSPRRSCCTRCLFRVHLHSGYVIDGGLAIPSPSSPYNRVSHTVAFAYRLRILLLVDRLQRWDFSDGVIYIPPLRAGYSRTDSNCRFRGQNPVCLTSTLREFMRAKGLEPSPLVLETSCLPLAMLSDWLDGI